MTEYLKLVQDKEGELKDLRSRMDTDKDLAQLKKYTMTDWADKAVKKSINVTLNKSAVFNANVEAALNNAIEQVGIISEDNKVDSDHIADCVRAGFAMADRRAIAQGRWPLNQFTDQQMCLRGGGAARVIFRLGDMVDNQGKKTRGISADITPWDRRFLSYDMGEEGLEWAAYRTTRTKAEIVAEYPDITLTKESGEVVDFWNREVNAIYIDDSPVMENPNPLGYVPVCVQLVTLGSMLADTDAMKYQGESIFFLIRDIVPEKNRLISIMQTLNMLAVKPPKEWQSKDGDQEAPDYDNLMAAGSITQSETGGGSKNIDFGDLKNAAIYSLNVINEALNEGSLEIINVGSLPGPLSAVALIEIGEGRDQVFLPRLAARGLLKQQIADMFLRQIMNLGESTVMLGTKGRQRAFQVAKLQGAYEVEFKYYVKSPKIDIARYSVAQVAERYLDNESIVRDVIQHEDPEGVLRRRYFDMAAKLSPLVLTRRVIQALTEMEDDDARLDAELLAMEMGLQVDQVLGGQLSTLKQPEEKGLSGGQSLIPLLTAGDQITSSKKVAQLKATPQGGE